MFYSIFLRSCGPKVQSFGATLFNMYVLTWSLLETFWVSYKEMDGVFKADVVDLKVENLKSFMSKGEYPTRRSVFWLDFSLFFLEWNSSFWPPVFLTGLPFSDVDDIQGDGWRSGRGCIELCCELCKQWEVKSNISKWRYRGFYLAHMVLCTFMCKYTDFLNRTFGGIIYPSGCFCCVLVWVWFFIVSCLLWYMELATIPEKYIIVWISNNTSLLCSL